MKFDSKVFSKYKQLTNFEKLILRTCCYFPPKNRRERNKLVINLQNYIQTLTNAYRKEFWNDIQQKRVLDFGCGEGGFVLAMATNVDCIAEGVDIQDNFEVANNYIKKNKIKNIKFHIGSSEKLEDNTYDVIISHDSFEHFEEPESILEEMVRLLKPDGHLLIKFGPTWRSPYGRHMGGTFKKSRPWIHLLIPEKNMMRVHSVYHNNTVLHEKYIDLIGGLNKMTIAKAKVILKSQQFQLEIVTIKITPWRGLNIFVKLPILKELFGSSVYFKCKKKPLKQK